MIERIEKLEEDLNIMKYNFEFTKKFIEGDIEKTEAMRMFIESSSEMVKKIEGRFTDLEQAYVTMAKNNELQRKLIESQGKTISSIIEMMK